MIHDPIVEEIRERRRAHAEKYDNNIRKIVEALRASQNASGREIIRNGPRKLPSPLTSPQG